MKWPKTMSEALSLQSRWLDDLRQGKASAARDSRMVNLIINAFMTCLENDLQAFKSGTATPAQARRLKRAVGLVEPEKTHE